MAQSLVLMDGSTRLIFNDDDRKQVLAKLIQEYLGQDCEDLFYNLLEEEKSKHVHLNAADGDDYEQIADDYLTMLRDVLDALDEILLLFDAARLNRRKAYRALRRCRDHLYNNLRVRLP